MKKKEPLITLNEAQEIMEMLKTERVEKAKPYAHIYADSATQEGVDDSYTLAWKAGMGDLINRIIERINNE